MNKSSFFGELAELISRHWPGVNPRMKGLGKALVPHPGTVIATILVIGAIFFVQNSGAFAQEKEAATVGSSTTMISYQGRLTNSNGAAINSAGLAMVFRLYNASTGGSPLWTETRTSVPVEDGLFNVLLGSVTPIPVTLLSTNSNLWLGITVGADAEMTPREQIASVPYAMVAGSVADGSITSAKLGTNSVSTTKIADGAVTKAKLAPNLRLIMQDYQAAQSSLTGSTSFQDKCVVTVTTGGSPLLIQSSFSYFRGPAAGFAGGIIVRITVDGQEKTSTGGLYPVSNTRGSLLWVENGLPAGQHTIKLQFAPEVASDTAYLTQANLVVSEH